MSKNYYIYILSNCRHTVYYTGITNDLKRRIYEHKNKLVEGFTKKYNVDQLLYYEIAEDPKSAILREKQIKDYRREKKIALIKTQNSDMIDLYGQI